VFVELAAADADMDLVGDTSHLPPCSLVAMKLDLGVAILIRQIALQEPDRGHLVDVRAICVTMVFIALLTFMMGLFYIRPAQTSKKPGKVRNDKKRALLRP